MARSQERASRLPITESHPSRLPSPESLPQLRLRARAELIAHYQLNELSDEKQGRTAFSTRAGYESYLKGWIVPRWGDLRIDQIKSVAVEEWLDSIKRAKGTRAKDPKYHERNLPSRDALRVG
jgi:hypothetical protein